MSARLVLDSGIVIAIVLGLDSVLKLVTRAFFICQPSIPGCTLHDATSIVFDFDEAVQRAMHAIITFRSLISLISQLFYF